MFYEHHKFGDAQLKIYFECQKRTDKEPTYELHWHSTPEFIYLFDGTVRVQTGMDSTEVSAKSIIAINPQCPHRFAAVGSECSYYCLIPDNSIIRSVGLSPEMLHFQTVIKDEKIIEKYLEIIKEYRNKEPYYKQKIQSLIIGMVAEINRLSEKAGASLQDRVESKKMSIVKTAISYLDVHFAEQITIDSLCEHLKISKSYLCRLFREITGLTMIDNLNYIRCRNARLMLENEGISVQEAAYRCGFNDSAYFCKIYKKYMNNPPSKNKSAISKNLNI